MANLMRQLALAATSVTIAFACPPSRQETIDFLWLAQNAKWSNDLGARLPFPGDAADSRGFGRILTAQLEDGIEYLSVLEAHPRWDARASILGTFRITVPPASSFYSHVGFMDGADASDGVTFQVLWRSATAASVEPTLLGTFEKHYNGALLPVIIDLAALSSQSGDLILQVTSGRSSARDWAVWQSAALVPTATLADRDHDGIADATEAKLLDRFSPYLMFSHSSSGELEKYRPTDAIWFARRSDFQLEGGQILPFVTKALYGNAGVVGNTVHDGQTSNVTLNPRKTKFQLDIRDEYHEGFLVKSDGTIDGLDWGAIKSRANVGLYGHVVPESAAASRFKIEFWQFAAYNRQVEGLVSAGHEGDWMTVQLFYDVATDKVQKVDYYHHGALTTINNINWSSGRILTPDVREFQADDEEVIRFFRDPATNRDEHPLVYIEWASHEFWPTESGFAVGSPGHPGDGDKYLARNVPNLGEVEHPLSSKAEVIMCFNGAWGAEGSPPLGPALHKQWKWPHDSSVRWQIKDDDFE